MQLSVEVKQQNGTIVYLCRGKLLRGWASEYLLELLTRSSHCNVIVDMNELSSFDGQGLSAVALSCSFLWSCHRRLILRNASSELAKELANALREKHGAHF